MVSKINSFISAKCKGLILLSLDSQDNGATITMTAMICKFMKTQDTI